MKRASHPLSTLFRLAAPLALSLTLGCAGLMMNVKDMDKAHSSVTLSGSEPVQVDRSALEASFAQQDDGKDSAKLLADELADRVEATLRDRKIQTGPGGARLTIKITNYQKGCGACRGFFPVFGLGASFLDGEVTLTSSAGRRALVVSKTGQKSGISEMGDQTETNMGYFATVVVDNLVATSKGATAAND